MKRETAPSTQSDLPAGLARPALRALASAGVSCLDQLTGFHESEIQKLHGIGPNALKILTLAMAERGVTFAGNTDGKNG